MQTEYQKELNRKFSKGDDNFKAFLEEIEQPYKEETIEDVFRGVEQVAPNPMYQNLEPVESRGWHRFFSIDDYQYWREGGSFV